MNFYLSAVDDQMRHIDDDLSIGLILCKTRSKVIAEYALRNVGEPMGIARYTTKLREALPNDLKGSLPSPKELEDELLVDNAKKRRDGPNRSWTMTPRDDSLSNDADAGGENAAASGGKFETDERALAREQAAADSRSPAWDLASRIEAAIGALERGVPAEIVRKTYGDKVFAEAIARRSELGLDTQPAEWGPFAPAH